MAPSIIAHLVRVWVCARECRSSLDIAANRVRSIPGVQP
jgi:hypothetical protein